MTTNRTWLALPAAFMLLFAACSTGGGATTAPSAAPPSVAPVSEAPASVAPSGTPVPESIKIGFVTHVLGNPFIQQIIDGANAAADDLDVELQVTGPEGGDADAQLRPSRRSSRPASRASRRPSRANRCRAVSTRSSTPGSRSCSSTCS